MEVLKTWILGITAASIIVSAAAAIAPQGHMRSIVRFIGGLVLFISVISPLKDFNLEDMAFYQAQYRAEYEDYEEKLIFNSSAQIKLIIEDRTRTYILQKADSLQLDCDVTVITKAAKDAYPYPAEITGTYSGAESAAEELKRFIESELGVPKEKQKWNEKDG
ncbi:MAG: stage III sporulation protein AF [Oscillospiraceae bacterium]|nr:stage III sporulation protein AF [Oscillospiraceae bacterium]